MAYGRRLYQSFDDVRDNTTWTLEIYQNGYAGADAEVTLGEDPCLITKGGSGWKNIVGSEMTVTLLTSESLEWFNTSDATNIKVTLKKAGNLWWSGFALPDQYYDSLGGLPREFTFTASDRLGVLDNINYVDGSGDLYEGYEKDTTILAQVLEKTGLTLDMRTAVNLFESSMDKTDADDPLYQAETNQDVVINDDLEPGSCYAMLRFVLEKWQAMIFQADGEWWVVRIPELVGPLDYRLWTYSAGDYVYSSNNSYTPQQATGAGFDLLANGVLETRQPYISVKIDQNYNKRQSVFRGWKFPENEFITDTTFKHWLNSIPSTWTKKQAGDDFMIVSEAVPTLDRTNFIRTERVAVKADVFGNDWRLSMKAGGIEGIGIMRVELVIEPDAGGNAYFCYGGQQGLGEWRNTGTAYYCIYPTVQETTYDNPIEFSQRVDPIPVDGSMFVNVYAPTNTKCFVSELKMMVTPKFGNYPENDSVETVISSTNNEKMTFQLNVSDSPETDHALYVYKGVVRLGADITSTWDTKVASGTTRTLSEWLQQWSDETKTVYVFRGEIYGASDFFNVIQLTEYNDELFFWENVEFNVKQQIWYGSAIQLKGVLLEGSTDDGKSSRASVVAISGDVTTGTGGTGGDWDDTANIPYRTGTETLVSGLNTVTFSMPVNEEWTYDVIVIRLVSIDGYTVGGVISGQTFEKFDITVDEAATLTYFASRRI